MGESACERFCCCGLVVAAVLAAAAVVGLPLSGSRSVGGGAAASASGESRSCWRRRWRRSCRRRHSPPSPGSAPSPPLSPAPPLLLPPGARPPSARVPPRAPSSAAAPLLPAPLPPPLVLLRLLRSSRSESNRPDGSSYSCSSRSPRWATYSHTRAPVRTSRKRQGWVWGAVQRRTAIVQYERLRVCEHLRWEGAGAGRRGGGNGGG